MAALINGVEIADRLCAEVASRVRLLQQLRSVQPALAVILVGDHPPSQVYVSRKIAKCKEVGIRSVEHRLPEETSQEELLALIATLNEDSTIHGILVQLPLPRHINSEPILSAISPDKDVDGFHPVNVGRLSIGAADKLVPCTPLGCMLLLDTVVDDYRGRKAVVIGKSNVVGKPMALLLLDRECTVTVCHIRTRDLADIVRTAEIVIVAAGAPGLVRGDWVKPGAVVIDVGITRVRDADGRQRVVGDACLEELDHAAFVTPVPGGVGPMTIACLLSNTVRAADACHA
jgi:methylenetetrahydrofolate dehydrogenase (NADP+)/methenyltetrahydrofolate cyclohydrolase